MASRNWHALNGRSTGPDWSALAGDGAAASRVGDGAGSAARNGERRDRAGAVVPIPGTVAMGSSGLNNDDRGRLTALQSDGDSLFGHAGGGLGGRGAFVDELGLGHGHSRSRFRSAAATVRSAAVAAEIVAMGSGRRVGGPAGVLRGPVSARLVTGRQGSGVIGGSRASGDRRAARHKDCLGNSDRENCSLRDN